MSTNQRKDLQMNIQCLREEISSLQNSQAQGHLELSKKNDELLELRQVEVKT